MSTIQKVLEIAQRMEKDAEKEEKQGRYDVEAMLRGYVTELRKATVIMASASDIDTATVARKRKSVHDLNIPNSGKELKQ